MAAMIASRAEERKVEYARRQAAKTVRAVEVAELKRRRAYALPLRHLAKLAHAEPRERTA